MGTINTKYGKFLREETISMNDHVENIRKELKNPNERFARMIAGLFKIGRSYSLITRIMMYAEDIYHNDIRYPYDISEDKKYIVVSYKGNKNLMPFLVKEINSSISKVPNCKEECDALLPLFAKNGISRIAIASAICKHFIESLLIDYYGNDLNNYSINEDSEVDKCITTILRALESLSIKEMLYVVAVSNITQLSTQKYLSDSALSAYRTIQEDLNILLTEAVYLDVFGDFPANTIEIISDTEDDIDYTDTKVIKVWESPTDKKEKTTTEEDIYGYAPYYITYAVSNYDFRIGAKAKGGKIRMYIYDDSKINFSNIRHLFDYFIPSTKPVSDIYVRDVIELTDFESQDAILSLYDKTNAGPYVASVPADIIISNTIPLKEVKLNILIPGNNDCIPDLSKYNKNLANLVKQHPQIFNGSYTIQTHIKIFDTSEKIKRNAVIKECIDNPEFEMIGMMTLTSDNVGLASMNLNAKLDLPAFASYLPIWLDEPNNRIFVATVAAVSLGHITSASVLIDEYGQEDITESKKHLDESDDMDKYNYMSDIEATRSLELWYGCQIALLNPIITNVVSESASTRPFSESPKKTNKSSKKKTKIRYERIHYINANAINGAIQDDADKRGFNRKCHCWYVIGHWRHYATKTIWIDGYWKGDMRFLKKSDDERTREVLPKD